MSDRFKFRAWWFQQKKMDYPSLRDIGAKYSWPLDWCELMQFTGLCDKNGKEIFEGDVMRHPHFGADSNLIVEFRGGCYELSGWDCVRTEFTEGEIIGNIWEHPELLNKEPT